MDNIERFSENRFRGRKLSAFSHIHFIGIGGISMSGLAFIMRNRRVTVSGSDREESELVKELRAAGAVVYIGQRAENIVGADLIVYTAAIREDNPELAAARASGAVVMSRADFLGLLMAEYSEAVCISGTHGKTTTTGMLASIMLAAEADPTVLVGGIMPQLGSNYRVGGDKYFLAEACEYTSSFLHFFPTVAVILNIEMDHPDWFKDIDHVKRDFGRFAQLIPEGGTLICCADDVNAAELLSKQKLEGAEGISRISYGISDAADYRAENIGWNGAGCASFTLTKGGVELAEIQLNVAGRHNIENALAACTAADVLGASPEAMAEGLAEYGGMERRFEFKGKVNGADVIEDYAHHPTEIKAVLQAAETYPHRNVFVVFQPHTYSRTKRLYADFVSVLSAHPEWKVILCKIYAAREQDDGTVSSVGIAADVAAAGASCIAVDSFESAAEAVRSSAGAGDLVLVVGAGDVWKVSKLLTAE